MKPTSLNLVTAALVAALSLTTLSAIAQSSTTPHSNTTGVIEGGWLFTVAVPPGTPGPAIFQALDTFAKGGGWSGRASTDSATNWSPAYGSWRRNGEWILITQMQFSQDSNGIATGTVIVHKQVRFTGLNTLTGFSTVSFCDLNEQNCFSPPGQAQVTATRIIA